MTPTDVHNHVMPSEAPDLLNAEPVYGARVVDGKWQGVHHRRFGVTASFIEPAAEIAELDREGSGVAVVSPPPPLFFYCYREALAVGCCEEAIGTSLRLITLHGGGYVPNQIGRLRHARGVRAELARAPEDVTASLRQLYFDTITHEVEALRFLAHRVGVDHVLLGTDLPFDMAMRAPIGTLAEAIGGETVRRIAEEDPADLSGLAPVPG